MVLRDQTLEISYKVRLEGIFELQNVDLIHISRPDTSSEYAFWRSPESSSIRLDI
jgi:hypothetical protein